jgi:exonuclease VII small subunit
MAGCENYEKAIQGIEKGREFIVDVEKKVVETRKEAEKNVANILGKDTAKSDDNRSDE